MGLIKCEQMNEEQLRLFLDCSILGETRMLSTCLCYEIIPLPYLYLNVLEFLINDPNSTKR